MEINKKANNIIKILQENGFEAYVVGGCVRDSIMGREPKDWDITTNAKTSQIMQVFKGFSIIETGIKHGTVTIVMDEEDFEVTTYRVDGEYTDGRHPDSVEYTEELIEDLARRDFTINAIAYNDKEGFIDHFEGLKDIKNKVIKCVGNAEHRFEEDSLRVLRALRFSSVLEFSIEEDTKEAIFSKMDGLERVSKERITVELVKLLNGKNVEEVLMGYSEVVEFIIPEIKDMIGYIQNNTYHKYGIWEHTVKVIKNSPKGITRVAALFHDIGKPETYTFFEGQGHFYGHATVSERKAEEIMKRLKFSNKEIEQVKVLVHYHDMTFSPTKKFTLKMLNRMGEENFRLLLDLRIADIVGQGTEIEGDNRLEKVKGIKEILDNLEEDACFTLKDLSINGKDLMEIGFKQGKVIGDTLNSLLEEVIEGNIQNTEEELLRVVRDKIAQEQ